MTRVAASPGRGERAWRVPRPLAVGLAVLLALLLWPGQASAYSWMIRHGYGGCTTCHADPSGGELLTAYGRAQGDLLLRMRYGKPAAQPEQASGTSSDDFDSFDSFDSDGGAGAPAAKKKAAPAAPPVDAGPGKSAGFLGFWETPDWLLLGGSLRTAELYRSKKLRVFPMQMDAYGQLKLGPIRAEASLGAVKVPPGSPNAHRAQVTTAQDYSYNLISRTHWLAWDVSEQAVLRAGRINLPFGVRIPEHTLWVRDQTYTDRESDQQHGVAFAYNGEALRGELMGIAGNYQINPDKYRERGYSLFVEALVGDRLGVGLSSLTTLASADYVTLDQERTVKQAHGVFTRWAVAAPVVVLAEADALLKSRQDPGYVAFTQGDLEFWQGLHFILTGEVLDAGKRGPRSSPGNGEPRLGGWLGVNWFFLPHMDMRIDAILRQPVQNESTLTLFGQLHIFL